MKLRKRGPMDERGYFRFGTEKDVRDRLRKAKSATEYRQEAKRLRKRDF
jgi:hypothetical protein